MWEDAGGEYMAFMLSFLKVKKSKLAPINKNTVIPGITVQEKQECTVSGIDQGKEKDNG